MSLVFYFHPESLYSLPRLGRHGKVFLTIPSQSSTDEQKFIQKGEALGTDSLLDIDPKDVVFFVGGVPPDVTVIYTVIFESFFFKFFFSNFLMPWNNRTPDFCSFDCSFHLLLVWLLLWAALSSPRSTMTWSACTTSRRLTK